MSVWEQAIVLTHQALHALSDTGSIDDSLNTTVTDIKYVKRQSRHITIYYYGPMGCCPDEVLKSNSCSIEVAFKKHHLGGRCGCADKEVKLLLLPVLSIFDMRHTFVHALLQGYNVTVDRISLEEMVT